MTEHALIMCREPGRPSTLDKGHEEGVSAYASAGLIPGLGRSLGVGNDNTVSVLEVGHAHNH